jgi:hypothetical protein
MLSENVIKSMKYTNNVLKDIVPIAIVSWKKLLKKMILKL